MIKLQILIIIVMTIIWSLVAGETWKQFLYRAAFVVPVGFLLLLLINWVAGAL